MIEGVRGTRVLEGLEAKKYFTVTETFHTICNNYGFELIVLPTIEKVELFTRTVGQFSDIVTKQMYNFNDKKGRELVLRPEGTAGVIRNYIDKKYKDQKKYFYSEQMFRYERPQKGRYREFHQVGAEIIGSKRGDIQPISDIVLLGVEFLKSVIGVDEEITLKINSIGTNSDRKNYSNKLIDYFKTYENDLSEDSKIRLKNNPLRILDSSDIKDIEISKNAPKFSDHRSDLANKDYESFKDAIADVQFEEDQNLVRGLDYYNGITFEYLPKGKTGAQDALGGGGQYDSLSTLLGASQINGVGFAFGVDRLMEIVGKSQ